MASALAKPEYVGAEQIMSFYDHINRDNDYCYSLWYGRDIAFQYPYKDGRDAEDARKFLEDNLQALENNGNMSLFWLKFHPKDFKGDYITGKTDVITNTPVRVCDMETQYEQINGPTPAQLYGNNTRDNFKMFEAVAALNGLPDKINTVIDSKFTSFEERLKQLEDDKEPKEDSFAKIAGLLQNEPLVNAISGLLQRFIPQPVPMPVPRQIGYTEPPKPPIMAENTTSPETGEGREIDNDKLEAALDRLNAVMEIDNDLTLLADYAEKNPTMFNMMLTTLRAK